jgi:phosphoribosylformylglycinamidine synthase
MDECGCLQIRLVDDLGSCDQEPVIKKIKLSNKDPVDLHLELVLGKMPRKVWQDIW